MPVYYFIWKERKIWFTLLLFPLKVLFIHYVLCLSRREIVPCLGRRSQCWTRQWGSCGRGLWEQGLQAGGLVGKAQGRWRCVEEITLLAAVGGVGLGGIWTRCQPDFMAVLWYCGRYPWLTKVPGPLRSIHITHASSPETHTLPLVFIALGDGGQLLTIAEEERKMGGDAGSWGV